MKTLLIALALVAALPQMGNGQTTVTTLAFDLDAPPSVSGNYTKEVKVDGVVQTGTMTCVAQGANETSCSLPAPTLTPGAHTIEIKIEQAGMASIFAFTGIDPTKAPKGVKGAVRIQTRITINVGS